MLCGDEVGAIVADIGSLHSRFGSAGQDTPRHVFSSSSGIYPTTRGSKGYLHSSSAFRNVKSGTTMEIEPLITSNGINFDAVSSLLQHGVVDCMRLESQYFPLMFVENMFTSDAQKYKLMEIFFEEFCFSATYFPASAMLGSFCYGKPTSLVVDFGASHTTASPIVDGFVLEKSVIQTSRGGDWFDNQIASILRGHDIAINPWYEKSIDTTTMATPSFRNFHVHEILRDVKHWMCFASSNSSDMTMARAKVPYIPSYELPDGTTVMASEELCLLPERFFKAGRTRSPPQAPNARDGSGPVSSSSTQALKSSSAGAATILPHQMIPGVPSHLQPMDIDFDLDPIQELIYASAAKCDIDCRKEILSNIVLIGGGSLLDGLSGRLTSELTTLLPSHMKPKISTKLPMEQLYAPWIGGSILGICGTFQQLWMSRQEYQENGPVPLLANRRGTH